MIEGKKLHASEPALNSPPSVALAEPRLPVRLIAGKNAARAAPMFAFALRSVASRRRLSEEMFAELGYEPMGFSASVAARAAFRDSPQRFDIILTDETMPDLLGTALAHEIHQLRPDVPILLMSGYSGAQMLDRARAAGIREVLRKPLQSKDIAECFARVLRSLEPRKLVQP